jgi:hypothetical protein
VRDHYFPITVIACAAATLHSSSRNLLLLRKESVVLSEATADPSRRKSNFEVDQGFAAARGMTIQRL